MNYAIYDNKVNSVEDLEKYKKHIEKDIVDRQKELEEFVKRGNQRIQWIEECERNNNYRILGSAFKDGRNKSIVLIVRYPDGTDRTERYSYTKVTEMREKISELKKVHSGVDWSEFRVEI